MILSSLRAYVRTQTQTIESELPDTTVDLYLQEAFDRTVAQENQWPSYETTWSIEQAIGASTLTLPTDANPPAITGLFRVNDDTATKTDYRLDMESHVVCAEQYGASAANATRYSRFSIWSGLIHLWPSVVSAATHDWNLTGFRLPIDWIAVGPNEAPDCDSRLHQAFAHYAVALAYAQQEDEQLEAVYMERWQRDSQAARNAIMEPSQDRPLIMGPHSYGRINPHRQRPTAWVSLP